MYKTLSTGSVKDAAEVAFISNMSSLIYLNVELHMHLPCGSKNAGSNFCDFCGVFVFTIREKQVSANIFLMISFFFFGDEFIQKKFYFSVERFIDDDNRP